MDLYIVRVHPDGTKILVTGKHRGENAMDQLIIYALPEKLLTLDPEKEGLIKSRELKLICGHHFLHYRRLTNAEFIPGKRLSLVVQDQNTISLLEPESPDSGKIPFLKASKQEFTGFIFRFARGDQQD